MMLKKTLILAALCVVFSTTRAFASGVDANALIGLGMSPELAGYFSSNGIQLATLNNNSYLKSANATPAGSDLNLLKADTANNTFLNALTGKVVKVAVATTPEVTFGDDNITFIGNTGVMIAPTSIAVAPGSATTPIASWVARGINFSASGVQPYFPAAAVMTPSTSFPTPNAGDTLTQRYSSVATAAPTAAYVELPAATANVGSTFSVVNQGANPLAVVPKSGDTANSAAAATPYACAAGKWCDCTGITTGNWQCRSS